LCIFLKTILTYKKSAILWS